MSRARKVALTVMITVLVFLGTVVVIWVIYKHDQNTFYDQHGNLLGFLHLCRHMRS